MAARHLINENGEPFDDQELDALEMELDALKPAERKNFRDANARAVARHSAVEMLIVAGPGTGKSTLFKERILFWLEQDSLARILALSFVRKLVADLARKQVAFGGRNQFLKYLTSLNSQGRRR